MHDLRSCCFPGGVVLDSTGQPVYHTATTMMLLVQLGFAANNGHEEISWSPGKDCLYYDPLQVRCPCVTRKKILLMMMDGHRSIKQ